MVRKPTRKQIEDAKKYDPRSTDYGKPYTAAVMGAVMPLDRKAREMQAKWGDRLRSLVPPPMALRFSQVYEELHEAMLAENAVKCAEIATRLIKAWDILEGAAIDAGHSPLPEREAFAVVLGDGRGQCIAICGPRADVATVRRENPTWVVYSAEDAARVIVAASNEIVEAALRSFPSARITRISGQDLGDGDDIPF